MSPEMILYLIIGILLFNFLFEQFLDRLNILNLKKDLPEELSDIYTGEEWEKARNYQKTNYRFSIISSVYSLIPSLAFFYFGGFGWLYSKLEIYTNHQIVLPLVFFGTISFVSGILSLPFSYYHTFVIEEKFGFNKSSRKLWFTDLIKSSLLGLLIGAPLLAVLFFLIDMLGKDFWWVFWLIAAAFSLFMNMFYTSLILPIFNKLQVLEDGELKEKIEELAKNVDFPLQKIMVIDGSKRSAKSNAFFSGMGKNKKVVFYDTLLNNHSVGELLAILAHEIGHYKKKHIQWGLLLSILQMGLMLYIISLFVFNTNLSIALAYPENSIALNLIAFSILFSPISKIIGIFFNYFSRKNEYEADAYASKHWNADDLISALKHLSVKNLSNILPHKAYVFFHYSHPTLYQRMKALKKN
jgi:STE24 endopeptidase